MKLFNLVLATAALAVVLAADPPTNVQVNGGGATTTADAKSNAPDASVPQLPPAANAIAIGVPQNAAAVTNTAAPANVVAPPPPNQPQQPNQPQPPTQPNQPQQPPAARAQNASAPAHAQNASAPAMTPTPTPTPHVNDIQPPVLNPTIGERTMNDSASQSASADHDITIKDASKSGSGSKAKDAGKLKSAATHASESTAARLVVVAATLGFVIAAAM